MEKTRLVKISKYLSKHLRHQPQRLGLRLDAGGWVPVEVLLHACARHHFPLSRAELDEVVAKNDKQRFAFDPTGTRIRANQGHSVPVDLALEAVRPPPVLYHGTGQHNVNSIWKTGLHRMHRHHVHLSSDIETAVRVGARHGAPAVFAIDTLAMQQAGYAFYRSANGVWLVDEVPPGYLRHV